MLFCSHRWFNVKHVATRFNCISNNKQVIAEVRSLQEQARLIVAGNFLKAVDHYLAKGEHRDRKEVKAALALLGGELEPSFDELRQKAKECQESLADWHSVRRSL